MLDFSEVEKYAEIQDSDQILMDIGLSGLHQVVQKS